jgi:outer membrane protein TolC
MKQPSNMNLLIMQRISLCLLCLAVTGFVNAQVKTPTPANTSTYRPGVDTSRLGDIREKLVLLALQNPGYEIADRQVNVADYTLRKAKGSWLSLLSASGNLNELSLKGGGGGTGNESALFYPRYNFNLTLPLDFITARSNDVKVAREQVYIAEAQKNEKYRQIRKEVLTRYEDYVMFRDMLEIQSRVTQSEYTKYRLAEKDFEDNLITADVFNKAEAIYLQQLQAKTEAQRNYNVAKLQLEELIGVSIDEVLGKK